MVLVKMNGASSKQTFDLRDGWRDAGFWCHLLGANGKLILVRFCRVGMLSPFFLAKALQTFTVREYWGRHSIAEAIQFTYNITLSSSNSARYLGTTD